MRNKILILLSLCFISCKTDIHKNDIKEKTNVTEVVKDTIFVDDRGDTIKLQTYKLKNDYKLIIFPAWNENEKVLNFRLIHNKSDNTYLLNDTFKSSYFKKFKEIDFNNYFALHSNGGGTSHFYFWLYDKESGKEVLKGIEIYFDLINDLIIYEDEDDDYKIFVYDVNTKIKTLVKIPDAIYDKYICTHSSYSENTLIIRGITNDFYYLGFKCCDPLKVNFKVKKVR